MCVYVCVCVCRCMRVCAHACAWAYIYIYIYTHTHTCMGAHTHVCIHVCAYIQFIVLQRCLEKYARGCCCCSCCNTAPTAVPDASTGDQAKGVRAVTSSQGFASLH